MPIHCPAGVNHERTKRMYYFIYCKGPNEKRFTLCNPWKGTRGMGKVYAPRFLKDQADYAVAWMAEHNPSFIFQRRPAR